MPRFSLGSYNCKHGSKQRALWNLWYEFVLFCNCFQTVRSGGIIHKCCCSQRRRSCSRGDSWIGQWWRAVSAGTGQRVAGGERGRGARRAGEQYEYKAAEGGAPERALTSDPRWKEPAYGPTTQRRSVLRCARVHHKNTDPLPTKLVGVTNNNYCERWPVSKLFWYFLMI